MKKIIVCWYGSFSNNGTIGDLLAVETLTNYLSKFYQFDHLTHCNDFKNIKGTNVFKNCDYKSYDIFIFCCGPIIKNHSNFNNLINNEEIKKLTQEKAEEIKTSQVPTDPVEHHMKMMQQNMFRNSGGRVFEIGKSEEDWKNLCKKLELEKISFKSFSVVEKEDKLVVYFI